MLSAKVARHDVGIFPKALVSQMFHSFPPKTRATDTAIREHRQGVAVRLDVARLCEGMTLNVVTLAFIALAMDPYGMRIARLVG